jgi:hypothetical protein
MAYTKESVNAYVVFSEALTLPDSAGANVVTVKSSVIEDGVDAAICGKKFPIMLLFTEASAGNGGWDVDVEVSHDGTNYVQADDAVIDALDSTGLNGQVGLADLTNIYAPYVRFSVLSDGTDTQDAAAATLYVAVPGRDID